MAHNHCKIHGLLQLCVVIWKLSGEEEATFDWLGVNSIYNTLVNNDDDQSTYGALDLGGGSTQIAFAAEPSGNILADFTAVRLWETTHRLCM